MIKSKLLNIPSGVLFQMHRAASTGQPGVMTEVGLGTYTDPRLEGAKMNAVTQDFVQLMKVDGNEYLFYPAINVDVAIIRATTADPYGNLSYEEECSTLGALDQAYAAHNSGGIVIAQVKRLSEAQLATQVVRVPGIRRRRLQRHHHSRTQDRLFRLLHCRQEGHPDRMRPAQDHL
jgi:propionate CoA-transferase